MKVPLVRPDLPPLGAIEGQISDILSSGRVTNFGPYVAELEEIAGQYLGCEVASTSSGTAGLVLALHAAGVQNGDRVVLPSFTFVATAQAVLYAGGVPVFADIDDDFTLSPDDLQRVLSQHRNVRAVVPVHTFGHPCRVAELDDVARTYGEQRGRPIRVVYDAAHAFGSAVGERRVGIFGDAEVFSLSATKVLVSVEGGLVSSRDPELLARVRKMRNYGIEANYDAHWPGLNGKMSELHALIGLYNLKRLESLLEQRIARARYYVGLLERETSFRPPVCKPNVRHTFKDFTVMVPDRLIDRRDAVMRFLAERGIETRAYFSPPLHRQRFFARFADRPLPKTDELSRRVIALPFYTTIRESEMDYVVEALKAAERSLS